MMLSGRKFSRLRSEGFTISFKTESWKEFKRGLQGVLDVFKKILSGILKEFKQGFRVDRMSRFQMYLRIHFQKKSIKRVQAGVEAGSTGWAGFKWSAAAVDCGSYLINQHPQISTDDWLYLYLYCPLNTIPIWYNTNVNTLQLNTYCGISDQPASANLYWRLIVCFVFVLPSDSPLINTTLCYGLQYHTIPNRLKLFIGSTSFRLGNCPRTTPATDRAVSESFPPYFPMM